MVGGGGGGRGIGAHGRSVNHGMGHGRGVKHKLKLNVNGWMDVIFIAIHDLINRSVLIQRQRLIISQLFGTDNIVMFVDQTNLHT